MEAQRLALVLAIQAEIESMKLKNLMVGIENIDELGYPPHFFDQKAEELRNLAYTHEQQLFG